MKIRKWIKLYITIPIVAIASIFTFNFIIDPYSLTAYNLLKIPNKFARDDRKEKVARLYKAEQFDNMIFGSSRTYSMNPNTVTKYLGGSTYNAGVGTARIEDALGFLLFLEKLNKLPKNVIIGLDFYSFNENVETNKYFLQNDELNFMNKSNSYDNYFGKFLSIDALRASFKTLKNFFKNSKDRPRFSLNGGLAGISNINNYYPVNRTSEPFNTAYVNKEFNFIKTIHYTKLSQNRLNYLKQIMNLSAKYNINTYIFLTPLHTQLIQKIKADSETNIALGLFKKEIVEITPYYDFISSNSINDDSAYFGFDLTHASSSTGNLIFARMFNDKNITLPNTFGKFIKKRL